MKLLIRIGKNGYSQRWGACARKMARRESRDFSPWHQKTPTFSKGGAVTSCAALATVDVLNVAGDRVVLGGSFFCSWHRTKLYTSPR